jgi:hypothetical protein
MSAIVRSSAPASRRRVPSVCRSPWGVRPGAISPCPSRPILKALKDALKPPSVHGSPESSPRFGLHSISIDSRWLPRASGSSRSGGALKLCKRGRELRRAEFALDPRRALPVIAVPKPRLVMSVTLNAFDAYDRHRSGPFPPANRSGPLQHRLRARRSSDRSGVRRIAAAGRPSPAKLVQPDISP